VRRRAKPRRGSTNKTSPGSESRAAPKSTLAFQIVQAAIKPEVTLAELTRLAQTDPAFTIRLISVVNSAAYGLRARVEDVGRAAAMLGIGGLRNLALGMSVVDVMPSGPQGELLLGCCLRRGLAARMIAKRMRLDRENECFTAGLLLEFGLLAHADDRLEAAAGLASQPAGVRIIQELAAGLVPHPQRGADVARQWELGEQLVEAIEHHHDDLLPEAPLAKVGWVAERVAAVFEGGAVEVNKTLALEAFEQIGLNERELEDVINQLPPLVREAASGFNRHVEQLSYDELMQDANARLVDLNNNFQVAIRRLESLLAEKEALTAKLEEANRQLERHAATDGLTGLLNHRAFQEALHRDLHRISRSGVPLSIVMLDVDHFKSVNDTHGHQAGDLVLNRVAELIVASTREGDVPARYGGEEFAVILPGTCKTDALLVASRIRERLETASIKVAGSVVEITASFGVSTVDGRDSHMLAEEVIAAADRAMYKAKAKGRNCVVAAADPKR